jgi:hypothetical protein
MTREDAIYHARWKAASNGAGARRWFVTRIHLPPLTGPLVGHGAQVAHDAGGRIRRFASCEAASRLAEALNARDGAPV